MGDLGQRAGVARACRRFMIRWTDDEGASRK